MLLPYYVLLVGLAAVSVAVRILSHVEWWQRKEYRWDRIRSQLFSAEVTTLILPWWYGAIGTTALGWVALYYHYKDIAVALGGLGWLLILIYDGWRTYQRGVFRPVWTLKALGLTGVVAGMTVVIALKFFDNQSTLPLRVATLALGIAVLTPLGVALVSVPVALRKKDIIAQAKKVRLSSRARVFGITGSYGKTSTKFFLQQLLKDEPATVVTAEHRNSALAVAQDVVRQLESTTRLYIVEMAAYRRGEIREICAIVQPCLGLLTAISNQHVALFGSGENIAAAKWELIEALPIGGVAILNADDPTIVARSREVRQKIVWFSSATPAATASQVFVSAVTISPHQIRATLHLGTAAHTVTIPLVSRAMLGSAIAAAAGAFALGVAPATIFRNIQHLRPYAQTMAYQRNSRGAAVIDDSYSGNEQGVVAAVEHLQTFANMRKIVVVAPLIELGTAGRVVHRRIGAALARSGATVYVTSSLYQEDLTHGGQKITPGFSLTVMSDPNELAHVVQEQMTSNTVVLLESRIPRVVRQAVLS